jgi:ATP-dependent RNA helicase RhlE
MGFIRDIRRVLALLPANRQNLLFSATFSNEIRELANGILKDPVPVEVARRNQESELVTQAVYACAQPHKRHLLAHLLRERGEGQAIVFTRTKHGADRLAKQLVQVGIGAVAIHGNRSQGQRTRALADFKGGDARVLVATDIAARGLDIEQLPHVFNYELPNVPEDYVHRIGRTGRAGSPGEAVSLVSPDEEVYLSSIERLIKKRVERRTPVGFTPPAASEVAASAAADAIDDAERRQRAIASRAGQRRALQSRQQGATAPPARPAGGGGGHTNGGGSQYPQPPAHQRPRPAAQPTHGPAQHAPRRHPQPGGAPAPRRGGWNGR